MENKILPRASSLWTNFFRTSNELEEISQILKNMPPFEKLNSKYNKHLVKIVHNRVYKENEIIFYQGDPGIGFYIIRSGEVEITSPDENKNDVVLAMLKSGDFFGEIALLDDQVRSATARAKKDTSIAVIFKPDLDEFMDTFPKAGVSILRGISKIITTRLKKINDDYISLLDIAGRHKNESD